MTSGGSIEGTQRPHKEQNSEGNGFRVKVLNGTIANNFHVNTGSSNGVNTSGGIMNKRIVIL
jgi:hypothetical protein